MFVGNENKPNNRLTNIYIFISHVHHQPISSVKKIFMTIYYQNAFPKNVVKWGLFIPVKKTGNNNEKKTRNPEKKI